MKRGPGDSKQTTLFGGKKVKQETQSNIPPPSFPASKNLNMPLAARVRPINVSDFYGQQEARNFLHTFLKESVALPSLILWGPSGSGKTTFSRLLARARSDLIVVSVSAVTTGSPELKKLLEKARHDKQSWKKCTMLFIDEIHRLNKAQQDVLLPYVEDGSVALLGCTTENPSFEINNALLSRAKVIVFKKLEAPEVQEILRSALKSDKGLSMEMEVSVSDEILEKIAIMADGDARVALNSLEMCASIATEQKKAIDEEVLKMVMQKTVRYDSSEFHYDLISALHKSIRGGDANAALYYCMRMLKGGEKPLYIARRLIRAASEDIGMANPQALPLAVAAYHACHFLGMPECNVHLCHASCYLALSPKSIHVYKAMKEISDHIDSNPDEPPPLSICNAPTDLMRSMGYGEGYIYTPEAENEEDALKQQYLPKSLENVDWFRNMEDEMKQTGDFGQKWKNRGNY